MKLKHYSIIHPPPKKQKQKQTNKQKNKNKNHLETPTLVSKEYN